VNAPQRDLQHGRHAAQPPIFGQAPAAAVFRGFVGTMASVVISQTATDAAFCAELYAQLGRVVTPNLNCAIFFRYERVKSELQVRRFRGILPATTEPSTPAFSGQSDAEAASSALRKRGDTNVFGLRCRCQSFRAFCPLEQGKHHLPTTITFLNSGTGRVQGMVVTRSFALFYFNFGHAADRG